METKTIALVVAISILTKAIRKNVDSEAVHAIMQKWIDTFSPLDNTTTITYNKSEDENRLWFILEDQKDSIMAQLGVAPAITTAALPASNNAASDETASEEVVLNETLSDGTVSDETVSDETTGAIAIVESLIELKQEPVLVKASEVKELQPQPRPQPQAQTRTNTLVETVQPFPALFSQPLKNATTFNETLCNALEAAFKLTNNRSNIETETIMSRLAEIETDLKRNVADGFAEMEARMTAKLQQVLTVACVSANNTESMTGMFNKISGTTKHLAEFTG